MKILQQIRKKYIIYLLPAFLLFSCGSRDVFNTYVSVDNAGWNADSICTFAFDINDTTAHYNTYINIRHRGDFHYQNLWLYIEELNQDSSVVMDTLELNLADSTGKWSGTGSTSVRHFRYLYKKNSKFPLPGKYNYRIHQGMSDEVLSGIVNVGVRIEFSE